jgi:hypothetical protein
MKQLSTIAIKLSLIIIAAAGIVAACSMNCGCCGPENVRETVTETCCTDQVSSMSLVPLMNGVLDETPLDTQNACTSCNCNTLPQKESKAVTSDNLSLKIHATPASLQNRSFLIQHNAIQKTSIVSINALSAPIIPLRI